MTKSPVRHKLYRVLLTLLHSPQTFTVQNQGYPAGIENLSRSWGSCVHIRPTFQCYSEKILFARIDRGSGRVGVGVRVASFGFGVKASGLRVRGFMLQGQG